MQQRQKITMSATIPTANLTWAEVIQEVADAGIPGTAKPTLHEHKVYSAIDHDEERISFTWQV